MYEFSQHHKAGSAKQNVSDTSSMNAGCNDGNLELKSGEKERERERSVRRNYRCDMFFVHITASSYLGNGFSNLHLADIIFSKICLVLCFEFIQRLEKKFYLMLLSEMGIQF